MYFLQFFRRTALFGILTLLICVLALKVSFIQIAQGAVSPVTVLGYFYAFMFWSIIAYPLFTTLHIIVVKIGNKRNWVTSSSAFETFLGTLAADLTLPFWNTGSFIAIMTKKHIIKDDSFFHNSMDFMEVLVGFIWTVFMVVFITIGVTYLF